MIKNTYILSDSEGLHAGPAGLVAKEAASLASSVLIQSGDKKGNAKSVMSIMGLDIEYGDSFDLMIEGPDENVALESIEKVMKECGII